MDPERLQAELAALRQQLADATAENAILRRQLDAVIPVATPEQEAEWSEVVARSEPVDFAAFIDGLGATRGTDGGR